MIRIHDAPLYRLTRHFFGAFFDFGFLSEAGARSFTHMLLGVCAVLCAIGLLLLRVVAGAFIGLINADTPEPYRQAVLAAHALSIALPMWTVAVVTVLVGHALFPDETDFRVLMGLPLTRRFIFGAKLAALGLFAGLFIAATHTALAPFVGVTIVGPWAEHSLLRRVVAYGVASVLGSVFAMLAIAATNGFLVVGVPRGRFAACSAALRSVMLCALVIALPLIARLPAAAGPLRRGEAWIFAVPPAWFMGLERWLLGDDRSHMASLAALAVASVLLVACLVAASFWLLYRHFECVIARPTETVRHPSRRVSRSRFASPLTKPVLAGVRTFVSLTLRRSALHQGIVVVLSALGVGFVINSLLAAGLIEAFRDGGAREDELLDSAVWASFALVFVVVLSVRAALLVPTELRANWIFRMIEQDRARVQQLHASVHVIRLLGVATPVAIVASLQAVLLGFLAIPVAAVAVLFGLLFVEGVLRDWSRIPFTCSYIPGKGFVPQTLLKALFSFILFTTFGWATARGAAGGHPAALCVVAIVAGATFLLARQRRKAWRHMQLEFEDQLPTEISSLKLLG
jgi:hypothetical protein